MEIENSTQEVITDQYPSLGDRVQSIFIDTVFIIIIMIVSSVILDQFEYVPDWVRGSILVGVFVIYEPVCVSFGCTIGNLIKGIRVRQNENEDKKINIVQAYIRYAVKFALGWLSFITIHSNPKKRAIHDIAAMSVMVKV